MFQKYFEAPPGDIALLDFKREVHTGTLIFKLLLWKKTKRSPHRASNDQKRMIN